MFDGLWTVPKDALCNGDHRTAVAFDKTSGGDYRLDGQSFPDSERHAAQFERTVTSTNVIGGSGSSTDRSS